MRLRYKQTAFACVAIVTIAWSAAVAGEFMLDCTRPACGKVCKLVSEKKKLTAVCYGCECKDICIPSPSRQGCKHCSTCYGQCNPEPCDCCDEHSPKCDFCWRDWFACGCAQPRTVKVLNKYQAEKEICWYHWEVVDAACCDCVTKDGNAQNRASGDNVAESRIYYKPAPADAKVGDVLPISDEEWVTLVGTVEPGAVGPLSQLAAEQAAASKPVTELQAKAPKETESESRWSKKVDWLWTR